MTLPLVHQRVLVVAKKTTYRKFVVETSDARIGELLSQKDPTVRKLLRSHEDHEAAIREVEEALTELGVPWQRVDTCELVRTREGDLVVTVGGDGTLLRASHELGAEVPVLGINSAPRHSVGFFCGGKKGTARSVLAKALRGALPRISLTRMRVELNGVGISARVLNEALYCHASPAATSRYILQVTGKDGKYVSEEQRSSGLWVGPAAGSTAAQRSAGGRILPLLGRHLQYVIREPYTPVGARFRFRRGLIHPEGRLTLLSKMREAKLFLDGHERVFDVGIGDVVVMRRADEPLTLLGLLPTRARGASTGGRPGARDSTKSLPLA